MRALPRALARSLPRALAALLAVTAVAAVAGSSWLVLQQRGTPDPAARSRGHDAVWLGHAWVDGRKADEDVVALAARLRSGGFCDVYVHVGPLADDGSLDPALAPRLGRFADRLRAQVPGLRVQAWLGNVVGPDRLRLDDAPSRDRVVAGARAVLDAGADGVHYDLEPLRDGDAGFLALLDATRAVTSQRGAVLSVAAEPVEPFPGAEPATTWARPAWWTPAYLAQVARRVDHVALMEYDTALPSGTLYRGLVARQVRLALGVVPDDVTLLVGLPAYHDATLQHRPGAETVEAAVRAARLALDADPGRERYGVALYVDFTATEDDWSAYAEGWHRPPG
jgi:hypothetical protein